MITRPFGPATIVVTEEPVGLGNQLAIERCRDLARTIRKVPAQQLEAEAWAPYGWLPLTDTDPRDGQHRLEFAWSDAHVNIIGHTLDELEKMDSSLRCREMFRHDTHTQTLMVLDHPAVIAVAPADNQLQGPDDAAAIQTFLLRPLDALVLARGTWHWGPYPVETQSVKMFNVQGLRYAEDNARADLQARGLEFDVPVGAPLGKA